MLIGFIGAGKVGFSLGKYLAQHGRSISGYMSSDPRSAQEAAAFVGATAFDDISSLVSASDVVFLTVPDGHIAGVWHQIADLARRGELEIAGKDFCHCSGALSSEVFEGVEELGTCGYSVHPLFAINSKTESYKELSRSFFSVEGDAHHLDRIVSLFKELGNPVQVIEAQDKVRYHAAAVMVSNQVIALYQLAVDELVRCGFSSQDAEKALGPLFIGNAEHIVRDGVVESLTGPAERGDTGTIQKHLACLEGDTKEVYRLLTDELLEIAAERHGPSMDAAGTGPQGGQQ